MTKTRDMLMTSHDDVELLLWDLARVSGTLSEIATVWRRALPYLPGLPLILPVRLQDSARQLAADIRARTGPRPGQPTDLALPLTEQLSALQDSIARAQAMTCGPGLPQVGDDRLWESLGAALRQACSSRT